MSGRFALRGLAAAAALGAAAGAHPDHVCGNASFAAMGVPVMARA